MAWRNAAANRVSMVAATVAAVLVLAVVVAAGTGTATGARPEARGTVADPREQSVLIVGDSLVASAQDLIASTMQEAGLRGAVSGKAVGGTGLLSSFPFGRTAGELLTDLLVATDPDIVVIGYSGNHPPPGNIFDNGYERGSERWHSDWNAELTRMIREAQSYGASVYVVAMPPMVEWTDPGHEDYPSARRNRVTHDSTIIASFLGAHLVDWGEAHSLDDRMPDGLHLSPSGAERVAGWTVDAIRPEWG